jgi:hypothetical protein
MNKHNQKGFIEIFALVALVVVVAAAGTILFINHKNTQTLQNFNPNNAPKFIQHDFIDLSRIYSISQFRSDVGHDYSDSFEHCASLKHYYQTQITAASSLYSQQHNGLAPKPDGKTDISIYAPVDGTIVAVDQEQEPIGEQLHIIPTSEPNYEIILFHVYPLSGIGKGSKITAGQKIAVISDEQSTDIAVQYQLSSPIVGQKTRLVSYFDVMPDSIFKAYQERGVTSRSELILSLAYRDAHPLQCSSQPGQNFIGNPQTKDHEFVDLSGYQAQFN